MSWRAPPAPRHRPTTARVTAWIAAGAVAAAVVAWALDTRVESFFAGHRSPGVLRLGALAALLGGREVVLPIALLGAVGLATWHRRLRPMVMVGASYLLAGAAAGALKELVDRPEPLDGIGDVGYSFPSGHATQAAAVYGMLAVLVIERAPPRMRAPVAIAATALCAVVGVALLARGAHWLSDIAAGYALGTGMVAATLAVDRRFREASSHARTGRQ